MSKTSFARGLSYNNSTGLSQLGENDATGDSKLSQSELNESDQCESHTQCTHASKMIQSPSVWKKSCQKYRQCIPSKPALWCYRILVKCNADYGKKLVKSEFFTQFLTYFSFNPDHFAARSLRLLRRNNYITIFNYL